MNTNILWLQSLNLPASVLDFYSNREMKSSEESNGVYLLALDQLKAINEEAVPGVVVNKFGWVVIANTVGGDAYCLDTTSVVNGTNPVYLVSHERGQNATLEEMRAHSKFIASSFEEFIAKFNARELPYDIDLAQDYESL